MEQGRNMLKQAGQVAGKRQVRFGANSLVMTLALIAILVLINILAIRNHVRWDLTAEGTLSLSQQTTDILQNLEQPVHIIGFFSTEQQPAREEFASLLQEYTARTDLVSYELIDPDVNPLQAREYNITSYGTIVVESGDRRQQINRIEEQSFTGAILDVTREEQTTVYFLTGHGERSIESMDQQGYSEARRVLQEDNLLVEPISLVISDTVPLTNSVLVVADPQRSLQERERELIANYVASGGRLMLLSDPLRPTPLSNIMEALGLQWKDDLIYDEQSEPGNPFAPAVVDYPANPITQDIEGPTLFPSTRSITSTESAATGDTATILLLSSQGSWSVTDFDNNQAQLSPDDEQGPLPFGFSFEGIITPTQTTIEPAASGARARMVIIGDADFANNAYIGIPAIVNRDFFRSAVGWLAAQDDEFTLPPRPEPIDRTVFLDNTQSQLVFWGSTLGLPLIVIMIGISVWWQRR
jgi:ABC-type uncharacterized transport system involved in gliding motility auxiliary subunit